MAEGTGHTGSWAQHTTEGSMGVQHDWISTDPGPPTYEWGARLVPHPSPQACEGLRSLDTLDTFGHLDSSSHTFRFYRKPPPKI